MKKAILYIHGKGGSYLEGKQYEKNCPGFDIIGVDYVVYAPWIVEKQIMEVYNRAAKEYDSIMIIANSIGAYFSMHTLQNHDIEKALFISPILDMERFILDMLSWSNATEQDLEEKGEIPTNFGETLTWEYLCYVRNHPIYWNIPTEILYGGRDNLTPLQRVEEFAESHSAGLTVMEEGEHWFHTDEQLAFLDGWMKEKIGHFMQIEILPAYDYPEEIRALFSEYTDMLISGDRSFQQYLDIQNYDEEIRELRKKYGEPYGRLYIAFCDGKAAGCIGLKKIDEKNCEMKRLYIRPEFRGNKLGEQLIQKILADAREIGYTYMLLDTLPFLESAVKLYEKFGFYRIERYNDSPMDTSIYMKKNL